LPNKKSERRISPLFFFYNFFIISRASSQRDPLGTSPAPTLYMSLILATGTNLGDKIKNLQTAKEKLSQHFEFIAESRIYESTAVDYTDQPDFFNQVLEFQSTNLTPEEILLTCQNIENEMGRIHLLEKGPRIIDIDVSFIDLQKVATKKITVPHPRLFARSFVINPLKELPYFQILKNHFDFTKTPNNKATPILFF